MTLLTIYGAVLMLALLMTPALGKYSWGDWRPKRGGWRSVLWDLVHSELGAVSVAYYCRTGPYSTGLPAAASTTGPTQTQAAALAKQSAVVVFGVVADAQALFTHNWQLDGSAPTFFEPEIVSVIPLSSNTSAPYFTFDWTNTNVLKINKAISDPPNTVLITIRRPNTPAN